MEQSQIFQPFAATMILTLVVWIYMYSRRLPFVLRNRLTPSQLTPAELSRLSPSRVSTPSDNLKNLFELPTIFYAVVLFLYATRQVDGLYIGAAWGVFAFRLLHSIVHCTFNAVALRFTLYVVSAVALWFMVARMALGIFGLLP